MTNSDLHPHKKISVLVPAEQDKVRLDKFLSNFDNIGSRSRAATLIESSYVRVNQVHVIKASFKVSKDDHIEVSIPHEPQDSPLLPYDIDLEIVFEDDHLLVVNKPAGLVVHPAAGHAQDTLVNALISRVSDLSMGFNERRPGIVHRLDKDTSGLLVVAKNDFAQRHLVEQFKQKSVHRLYKALVYGQPKQDSGTCRTYLIRHPVDRKKFCSEKLTSEKSPKGKIAITHFQLEKTYPSGLSLLSCKLETGRTHQIRVHMFERQHGIIADPIYNSSGKLKNLKSAQLRSLIKNLNRIGLHAEQLGFLHPTKNEQLHFTAPWPNDMVEIFKFLERK